MRAEAAIAASEREQALADARVVVSEFVVEEDKNNSTKVEELQQALIALGYTLRGRNNGVDGAWGGSTESAYNEEIAKIEESEIEG